MKLLHTADWHLGAHLGNVDRADDQFRSLERMMGYCEERQVDVMVVAGDIIEEYRGDDVAALVQRLARLLSTQVRRGMTVLLIPGNHDREHLFHIIDTIQSLSGDRAAQRVRFISKPQLVLLSDPGGDFSVQFLCAPYPTAHRYLPTDVAGRGLSKAERHQVLARAFADKLASAQRTLDPSLPAVLVSHIYVRTAETSSHYRLSETEDIPIEPQDIPPWAYSALGHIHKAQDVGGRAAVRYSGSIERCDAGEANDDKSCVLVEIRRGGLVGEPELLPLPATRIYTVTVAGGDDVDALIQRHPDHAEALVHLKVTWRPGVDNPHALVNSLQAIFPRYYRLEPHPVIDNRDSGTLDTDPQDLADTVHTYLARRLQEYPEQDRLRLLDLASTLVEEVRHAATAR